MIPKQVQERPSVSPRHICTNCGTELVDGSMVIFGKQGTAWKYCPICGEYIEWDDVVPVKWEPLDCNHCGKKLVWMNKGIAYASEDYIGSCFCMDCQIEHCLSTNCFGCRFWKYPGCKFQGLKEAAIRNRKDGHYE